MKMRVIICLLLLALTGKSGMASHQTKADSLSHLAYSKSNHDSAMWLFSQAAQAIENDTQRGVYYFYKNFYFLKNNYRDSAEKLMELTLTYLALTRQKDKFNWIFNTTYWVYVGESKYDKAMLVTLKVEKITRDFKDTFNHINGIIKLSNIYHDLANYRQGIQTAGKAINEAKAFKNNLLLSSAITMLAMNYDDWGKFDSAIYHYYTILNLQLDKDFDYSQVYNNLGNTYLKSNNLDSALKYVNLSYQLDKEKNKPYELATCINNLGHIYLKKKAYAKAKQYLDSAYYYATLSANHEKLRDVHYTLYLYHNDVNNHKQALTHLSNYHSYKDSILDVKRLSIIEDLENKAKEANYQNELLKLENTARVRNFWIALFAAMLLIALLIIRQVNLKRQRVAKEAELNVQKERLRISRDLHDNIGAELTFISSFIDQQTYALKDESAKKELEKISESSRLAMAQMRETIWAIQSKSIQVEELVVKLQQTLEKYTTVHHIQLRIKQSGENYSLKPAVIISVLRVCQEAINNAVKYGGCTQITLELNAEENRLGLTIYDNGVGFELAQVKRGNGLKNMQERIEELGGSFEVSSLLNIGTTLRFIIPLQI